MLIWSHAVLVDNLQTPETVSTLCALTTAPWASFTPLAPSVCGCIYWIRVVISSLKSLLGT